MLNPLAALKAMCAKRRIKLCADCISSVGVGPVNLEGVYLATAASGKGLAAYPGLCMVFYNHAISPSPQLPRYLDLGWYAEHQGINLLLRAYEVTDILANLIGKALKYDREGSYLDAIRCIIRAWRKMFYERTEEISKPQSSARHPQGSLRREVRRHNRGLPRRFRSLLLHPENQVCLQPDRFSVCSRCPRQAAPAIHGNRSTTRVRRPR